MCRCPVSKLTLVTAPAMVREMKGKYFFIALHASFTKSIEENFHSRIPPVMRPIRSMANILKIPAKSFSMLCIPLKLQYSFLILPRIEPLGP